MKKILFVLFVLLIPTGVKATEYYDKVTIKAELSENILASDVPSVLVVFDDAVRTFDFYLYANRNYEANLTDVVLGNIDFSMAMVGGDNIGKYNVKQTIDKVSERELNIKLIVELSAKNNSSNVEIPKEIIDKINNVNQSSNTTTSNEGTGNNTNKTTTTVAVDSETQKEKEEEAAETRNSVYKYIFIILGVCVFVLAMVAFIKISQANK